MLRDSMKLAVCLVLISINFSVTKCSVLYATKNVNGTENSQTQIESEDKSLPKTFLFNGSYVYLEDVMFVLKNQNWTEEEQPCLMQTFSLLWNLQNFTLWAVWDWDSIASEPQGLLFGSRFHLGNYDQCMEAPWYKDHEELQAQYCLANIVLERTDRPVRKRKINPYDPYQSALNLLEYKEAYGRPRNELIWGVCVPIACQRQSVTRLMGVLLAHSHLSTAGLKANVEVTSCEKTSTPLQYDGLFYSFIATIIVLILVCIVSTIMSARRSKYRNIITEAFDMKENARNLLKVKKDGIEVLYGIRFLTICIIVMCHQFGMSNSGPISNGYRVDKDVFTIFGLLMLHNDLTVDTFFCLSGFLTANVLARAQKMFSLPLAIFKRYVRLIVAYGIVIFFMSAVFPYIGSGPLWRQAWHQETGACRQNWWLSVLMLSNYIDTNNMCIIVSWYIPADFHCFVVTVLVYWLYRKVPSIGKIGFICVFAAAIAAPGIVNYIHHLPPLQLFTYEFIADPRIHPQFHLSYIKSHTRYAAYLVGFFSGCFFVKHSNKLRSLSKKWSTLGALAGVVLMCSVLFSGPTFLWRGYTVTESVVYAALNRPIWACGLAVFVLSCAFGDVPLLKSFFSWYPWVPLSRLAYGLYLVHTLIIIRNVTVARNMQHSDYLIQLTTTIGVITWGCVAALVIWLLVEAPFNNLVTLIFMPRRKESSEPEPQENKGYIQDNLPSTVQIDSSKM